MLSRFSPLPLVFLLSAGPVVAAPFVIRTAPAGYAAPSINGFGPMEPIAADFMGNGRKQWYQGGNTISRAPESGVLTLPVITLSQTPSATVETLAAAVADVDRDDDPDIIRINQWNGNAFRYTLQVFLNGGTGTFTEGFRHDWVNSLPYDEGNHHFAITSGDYNKDGTVDLAIAETYGLADTTTNPNHDDGQLYIRWNDGTGNFPTTATLQADGLSGVTLSTADHDRDGDADIVCSGYNQYGPDNAIGNGSQWYSRRSLLFTNGGTGTFTVGGNFSIAMPTTFTDMNGDGWADLVDGTRFALNQGDGTFGSPANWPSSNRGLFVDTTGSALPDSISVDSAQRLTVAANSGGTLGTAITQVPFPAAVETMTAADGDDDGDTDVFADLADGSFVFVENREIHHEPGAELAGSVAFSGITALHSADFFLDGSPDVMAVTPATERLWFINGLANGTRDTAIFKNTQGESAHAAAVADYDCDGRPDVAYTLPAAGTVRLARNTGAVPFTWSDTSVATGMAGAALIAAGEYGTPNGLADLFVISQTTGQLRGLYQSGGTWNSQTIFASLSPIPAALDAGQVVASSPGSEVGYLHADAAGLTLRASRLSGAWTNLGATRTETVTGGPHNVRFIWAETTGDRLKEGIFINGDGQLANWYPGVNASTPLVTGVPRIQDIVATDWDRDGRTDILCATESGLSLVHFRRSTAEWMHTPLHRPTSGGYTCVTTQDFNGDGWPDAVAFNPSSGRIDYLRGVPHLMRADFPAVLAPVEIPLGTTRTVLTLPVATAGRTAGTSGLADRSASIVGCNLVFRQAVAGPGGTLIPGAVISHNDADVSVVKLTGGGVQLLTDDTSYYDSASGELRMAVAAGQFQPLAPVAPAASVVHTLELTPFSNGVPGSFYVSVAALVAQEVTDDSSDVTGLEKSVALVGSQPVLVTLTGTTFPLAAWRTEHFGSPNPGGDGLDTEDPDDDGVPNLVEFATNTDPLTGDSALNNQRALRVLPLAGPQSPVQLAVTLGNTALTDPKVRVSIKQSLDGIAWANVTTRTGGDSWSVAPTATSPQGDATNFTFTTPHTPAAAPLYLFRLEVEELP